MQKELLSSFMDGESVDDSIIASLSADQDMQDRWHRYHLVRDTLRGSLYKNSSHFDVSAQVAVLIEQEDLIVSNDNLDVQPMITSSIMPKKSELFWPKVKDLVSRVTQVGLAACVTLAVITSVQYYSTTGGSDSAIPVLNTTPIGVNVSPVGGTLSIDNKIPAVETKLSQEQYDKLYLLLQDYELQKRINANR